MQVNRRPVTTLENPSLGSAVDLVKAALSERKGLIIVGNCTVEYHGRAKSKLEPGDRIVILKKDGAVLVHRPSGYEPVNWQPPGCLFQTDLSKGVLRIRAIRQKPPESVKLFFSNIHLVAATSLVDAGEFSLYASEEDMQKAILFDPTLIESGFRPIAYEKKVDPGFIDVYGIDAAGKFVVVEIKRKTASRNAVLQLSRYVQAIDGTMNREVRGILAAPKLGKGVQRLLETLGLGFRALDARKCAEILTRSKIRKLEDFA